jgi:phosphoserine phosphatase
MTQTVITIIAGKDGALDETAQKNALTLARGLNVGLNTDMLCPGKAMDITVEKGGETLMRTSRELFRHFAGFDVFVQPKDEHRRKRLLVADMDATIIEGETLDELAAHFGLKEKVAPITARAMNG